MYSSRILNYIYIIYSENSNKTETLMNNLNPKWNTTFDYPYSSSISHVDLYIYDYDKGSEDELMGHVKLDLRHGSINEADHLLKIHVNMKEEHKKRVQGSVRVSVTLE